VEIFVVEINILCFLLFIIRPYIVDVVVAFLITYSSGFQGLLGSEVRLEQRLLSEQRGAAGTDRRGH
jgi:hypothetical protein